MHEVFSVEPSELLQAHEHDNVPGNNSTAVSCKSIIECQGPLVISDDEQKITSFFSVLTIQSSGFL